jgi:hypothetical protein
MLRPKIYKQNRQTVWIIVKNKNTQALMTNNSFDHLDTVYYDSEIIKLLHRKNTCFSGCRTMMKIHWINIQD